MMGDIFGTLFGGNQQTSQADKTGKGMYWRDIYIFKE
jgi:hypothetical protein